MLGSRTQSSALPLIVAVTQVEHGEWRCVKGGTFALLDALVAWAEAIHYRCILRPYFDVLKEAFPVRGVHGPVGGRYSDMPFFVRCRDASR